jgi:TrmH family RNA methyltransferase
VSDDPLNDPRSPRAKRLRRLTRRQGRAQAGRFLVEGANPVREAVGAHASGRAIVGELVVAADAADRHAEVVTAAAAAGVTITLASDAVLAALSETVTPQGIVAVVETLDVALDTVLAAGPRLLAVLVDARDPGNAVSVVRSADAARAAGVVFTGDSVDIYNGKAVRSSVGGLFHLPVSLAPSSTAALAAIREAGLRIIVADGVAPVSIFDASVAETLREPTAWVFGNEAWGVPEDLVQMADETVAIPIYGQAESLNLATAAAVCLYASANVQRQGSPAGR